MIVQECPNYVLCLFSLEIIGRFKLFGPAEIITKSFETKKNDNKLKWFSQLFDLHNFLIVY